MPDDALGGPLTAPTGTSVESGLPGLISNLINLATIIAGIFVLINIIVAGFGFMTAGGDPKKITDAWGKIWKSLMGLIIIVAALAIISVIEKLFGISILEINITGPGASSL